jgi:hypothetical protein
MMKPGDLVRMTFFMPKIFESFTDGSEIVAQPGEYAVLVKHESDCFGSPCWQVLYHGHLGLVATRWLQPAREDAAVSDMLQDERLT